MSDPKVECRRLLDETVPFAERMLVAHGEFFPYGASMKPSGEIVLGGGYDGREDPPSQDLIDILTRAYSAEARAGKVKATAIVYDVRITDPQTKKKSDAIAVALDHRENYSKIVFLPYKLADGHLTIGSPFAEAGKHLIFSK